MKGNIIYKKTIPARSPEYAEFPKSLHPDIQDLLLSAGGSGNPEKSCDPCDLYLSHESSGS